MSDTVLPTENRPAWIWPSVGENLPTFGPLHSYQSGRMVYAFQSTRNGAPFYIGRTNNFEKRMLQHRRAGLHVVATEVCLWAFSTEAAIARFEATNIVIWRPQGNSARRYASDPELFHWYSLTITGALTVDNTIGCPACGRVGLYRHGLPFALEVGDGTCPCEDWLPWRGEDGAAKAAGWLIAGAMGAA